VLHKILPEVVFDLNFEKLWWAQILSQVAFNTLLYTMVIRIAERTNSNTAVSLFILSFAAPAVLFGIFAGVWVDRLDRRVVLIATNLLRTGLIPLFFLAEHSNFVAIYPLAVVTSIITQFFMPAEASKLTTLVRPKVLHQANSLFTFTLYTAIIIGPVAAGPALKILGLPKLFILMFILFVIATILTMLLPKDGEDRVSPEEERSIRTDLFDVFRHIFGSELVRGGILILTFSQTLISMVSAIAPGYARTVLQVDVADTSILMLAPAALGMIVTALLLSKFGHNFSKRLLVVAGVFLGGLELIALGSVQETSSILDPVYLAALLLFALGSANAFLTVPATTAVQIHTPEKLRGRVYGVLQTMVNGASFIPVLFAGIIADIFGVPAMVTLMGVAVFLAGFYLKDKVRARTV
jgi:MFS family permease